MGGGGGGWVGRQKKKAIGLITKTTTLHCVHYTFWYISLHSLHDYDVKFLDMLMEEVNSRRQFFSFSFSKLGCGLQEFNPDEISATFDI